MTHYNTEDCVCGNCPACRRSLRDILKPVPVEEHVELSERARKILEEPSFTRPATDLDDELIRVAKVTPKKPRAPRKQVARAKRKKWNEDGSPMTTQQRKDYLREYKAKQREVRYAERVEIDGRLTHPDAPHGSQHAYSAFGCRCKVCTDENARLARELRARRGRIAS